MIVSARLGMPGTPIGGRWPLNPCSRTPSRAFCENCWWPRGSRHPNPTIRPALRSRLEVDSAAGPKIGVAFRLENDQSIPSYDGASDERWMGDSGDDDA